MKLAFLISKNFGLELLKSIEGLDHDVLVIHPNDSKDHRSCCEQIEKYCQVHGYTFFGASSAKSSEQYLLSFKPDAVLVCGWYWLISGESLNMIPRGVYGVHHSLLPKYRGASPLVWSIIDGGKEVGSSLFRINAGMDTGEIVYQVKINLSRDEAIEDAVRRIEEGHLSRLPEFWANLEYDNIVLSPQGGVASYCAQRRESDGKICWSNVAGEIHDFIRAQSHPYPGAYSYLNNEKLTFLKTEELPEERWLSTPGQIIKVFHRDGSVLVGCGQSTVLKVCSVYSEAKGKQEASCILNRLSHRLI